MFRSTNPALNTNIFQKSRSYGVSESMTLQGVVNKAFVLLTILVITALFVWNKVMAPVGGYYGAEGAPVVNITPYILVGLVGGIITYIILMFNMSLVKFLAPVYVAFQGLFLGAVSAFFEKSYPGIASQAIVFTTATLLGVLMIYKSGLIKVTDKLRTGVFAAGGAIMMIYVCSWIMSMFGGTMPIIHSSSMIGIGFSVFVVVLAAFFLLLDFDNIHQGISMGASKEMEWYSAFGLMVTLIWLYLEILKLLVKLQNRR
jgi:uncharacterized YccA/Bax inhibitor family protein